MIFGQLTKSIQATVLNFVRIPFIQKSIHAIVTFILAAFAWVFFRANTNADSIYIVKNLFETNSHSFDQILGMIGKNDLYLIIISFLIMEIVQWQQRGRSIAAWFDAKPKWQRWAAYYVILFMILCYGVYNNSQFIYFQF